MSKSRLPLFPRFRGTVAQGRLTVAPWHPGLAQDRGPYAAQLRACDRAGIAIADLTVVHQPRVPLELIVTFLCGSRRPHVDNAIERWAAVVGYRRLWTPDALVDLSAATQFAGGTVRTRCPNCQTQWKDGSAEFWARVRKWGTFPQMCRICGGDLSAWDIAPSTDHDERRA